MSEQQSSIAFIVSWHSLQRFFALRQVLEFFQRQGLSEAQSRQAEEKRLSHVIRRLNRQLKNLLTSQGLPQAQIKTYQFDIEKHPHKEKYFVFKDLRRRQIIVLGTLTFNRENGLYVFEPEENLPPAPVSLKEFRDQFVLAMNKERQYLHSTVTLDLLCDYLHQHMGAVRFRFWGGAYLIPANREAIFNEFRTRLDTAFDGKIQLNVGAFLPDKERYNEQLVAKSITDYVTERIKEFTKRLQSPQAKVRQEALSNGYQALRTEIERLMKDFHVAQRYLEAKLRHVEFQLQRETGPTGLQR